MLKSLVCTSLTRVFSFPGPSELGMKKMFLTTEGNSSIVSEGYSGISQPVPSSQGFSELSIAPCFYQSAVREDSLALQPPQLPNRWDFHLGQSLKSEMHNVCFKKSAALNFFAFISDASAHKLRGMLANLCSKRSLIHHLWDPDKIDADGAEWLDSEKVI